MHYKHQHLTQPSKHLLWGLSFAMACVTAHAQNQAASNAAPDAANTRQSPGAHAEGSQQTPDIADGRATRAWLKAQDAGAQASKHKQTLSGAAMSRVHERYLNSFSGDTAAPANGAGKSTGGASSKP